MSVWRFELHRQNRSVVSSVARIPAFQAGGPGSIPGRRTNFAFGVNSAALAVLGTVVSDLPAWPNG